MTEGLRLQKFLAQAGVASRRRSEELMAAGRVEVDGRTADRPGMRVDPETAVVRVDGARVLLPQGHTSLLLNKPRGIVCSMADDQGRPDLRSLLSDRAERLYHVGRLDTDTSGLLIVTNHGELANRLAHPSFEVPKTYVALVEGTMTDATAERLKRGIDLDDGPARADRVTVRQRHEGRSLIEITVHIGRNRIVRRMGEAVGHRVVELTRTAFGPLTLGNLRSGVSRELTDAEHGLLFDSVGL